MRSCVNLLNPLQKKQRLQSKRHTVLFQAGKKPQDQNAAEFFFKQWKDREDGLAVGVIEEGDAPQHPHRRPLV